MKLTRDKRTQRGPAEPRFASEPAIVPTRPVVFDELRRQGWVHVMGAEDATRPGARRDKRRR